MDDPSDEHIIEAIGKSRILIRDGKIIEVGSAMIATCPLAERFAKARAPDHSRELSKRIFLTGLPCMGCALMHAKY